MPHQCVRCSAIYGDTDEQILKGCSCGAKLFFYIRKAALEKAKQKNEEVLDLKPEEKEQVEKDIYDILDIEDPTVPVILDIEAIRSLQPGKYELDLVKLFNDEPVIFKLADGKYVIDLAATFDRMRKK